MEAVLHETMRFCIRWKLLLNAANSVVLFAMYARPQATYYGEREKDFPLEHKSRAEYSVRCYRLLSIASINVRPIYMTTRRLPAALKHRFII